MKNRIIYYFVAVVVLLTIFGLSACNSDNPDESLIITVKGGPQQYQAIIDSSISWNDMDLDKKKSIALDCVTSCREMNPPSKFSLKGINKADDKELFTWNSTDELFYIDGEKVDM